MNKKKIVIELTVKSKQKDTFSHLGVMRALFGLLQSYGNTEVIDIKVRG